MTHIKNMNSQMTWSDVNTQVGGSRSYRIWDIIISALVGEQVSYVQIYTMGNNY